MGNGQISYEQMPDGTWKPRYKNRIGGKLGHKPRLLMQWGRWACISANSRGEGSDDSFMGAAEAYHQWKLRLARFERAQAMRRLAQL
jgi:hypothetical protein